MNKRVFFLLLVLMACAAQSMAQSMVWGINTREPENSIIRDCPDRAASVMYKQSYDSCRFYYVKYGSSSCISAESPSEYRVNDATPEVLSSEITPGERSVLMSIAEDRVDERVGYAECKEKPLYIVCEE